MQCAHATAAHPCSMCTWVRMQTSRRSTKEDVGLSSGRRLHVLSWSEALLLGVVSSSTWFVRSMTRLSSLVSALREHPATICIDTCCMDGYRVALRCPNHKFARCFCCCPPAQRTVPPRRHRGGHPCSHRHGSPYTRPRLYGQENRTPRAGGNHPPCHRRPGKSLQYRKHRNSEGHIPSS